LLVRPDGEGIVSKLTRWRGLAASSAVRCDPDGRLTPPRSFKTPRRFCSNIRTIRGPVRRSRRVQAPVRRAWRTRPPVLAGAGPLLFFGRRSGSFPWRAPVASGRPSRSPRSRAPLSVRCAGKGTPCPCKGGGGLPHAGGPLQPRTVAASGRERSTHVSLVLSAGPCAKPCAADGS